MRKPIRRADVATAHAASLAEHLARLCDEIERAGYPVTPAVLDALQALYGDAVNAVIMVKGGADADAFKKAQNRLGKLSVVIRREDVFQALDRHIDSRMILGENPRTGWRASLSVHLIPWKYLRKRLPDLGITEEEITAYLAK